ncbi:hypothetical protein M758_5G149000 [Ceratodon purpureus]|nr:hypothetical protein M758_5G149000 [Ceratodon purpureus]
MIFKKMYRIWSYPSPISQSRTHQCATRLPLKLWSSSALDCHLEFWNAESRFACK